MKFSDVPIGGTFSYKVHSGNHYKAVKIGIDSWQRERHSVQSGWGSDTRTIVSIDQPNSYQGAKTMLTEITNDLKGYVRTHKDLIYTVIIVALIDQYVFEGQFRERLRTLVGKVLGKAEEKINKAVDGATL